MADAEPHIDPAPDFDHSHELISSTRVEGTPIVNARGEKLGTLHSLMIHKETGQVAYAILSFGGFLGIGSRVHPIPWEKLSYDLGMHVYRVNLTREQLRNAPTLHLDEADRPSDRSADERLYDYYGANQYWGY
ncbi:PRC-barrel domain-containing protein [Sphingobium indicum]|uniref:PRC-barrel domain-containing protein n=1 Tax=Sphingobium indicum TaxID=332055 RepID=UPI0006885A81|nr:PRC-barrel domain-containing protein [Sphingobium indicum]